MTAFDRAWDVVKAPWREQWVDKEGLQTHTLPAGTTLYHGTPPAAWADDPNAELRMPAWFSDAKDVAHYFGGDYYSSEEEPNIHEYEVLEDIILPLIEDYNNEWGETAIEVAERIFGQNIGRDMGLAIRDHRLGYPGWAIPTNYDLDHFGPGGDYLLTALDKLRRIR